jgi:membrane-bound lytic murein transglycosylase F
VIVWIALLLSTGCDAPEPREPRTGFSLSDPVDRDEAQIDAEGVLRVGLRSDPTSWFVHRGVPAGLEHDLLAAFARDQGWQLELVRVRSREEGCDALRYGDIDLLAGRLFEATLPCGLPTDPLYHLQPAVVQSDDDDIDSVGELAGREVRVRRFAPWLDDLDHAYLLFREDRVHAEGLVREVAEEGGYAVVPAMIGHLEASFLDDVVVRPTFGPAHPVVATVRTTSPALRASFDDWLGENDRLRRRKVKTYFVDRRGRERAPDDLDADGPISDWDDQLQLAAERLDWPWTLLAAQAFKESSFDPDARSWAGAVGLMQLMPAAARQVGVTDRRDPMQSIDGGARYLAWLQERWAHLPDDERVAFVLASYNAGPGHVEDAVRLAEVHGDDPTSWDDVSAWLLALEDASVHRHPVVRYGYCRGSEAVRYVDVIFRLHRAYQALDLQPQENG